jgi:hypothetical protein
MALPNTNIGAGAPPLLWDNIRQAFDQINDNFIALDLATAGAEGAVDLSLLTTEVSPKDTESHTIGTITRAWKSIYTGEWAATDQSVLNGVWLGNAQIRGIQNTVDLPENSTVDGDLIIDPDKTTFKTIDVLGQDTIVASSFTDTLKLQSGAGTSLEVDSINKSITFKNTGVINVTGSNYLSITETAAGSFTFSNAGVTDLTNTTTLPSGRPLGAGVHVNNSTGSVRITNTGVLRIETGSPALTVFTDQATGIVTVTNNAPDRPAFTFIEVPGQPTITAGGILDKFRIESGHGIKITTNLSTKTITVKIDDDLDYIKTAVYANSAARNTSIPLPVKGMIVFNDETGKFEGNVNGTAGGWVNLN